MRKKTFTLLEVMVASFILSVSLIMMLQILGSSRARVLRAKRRWARTHLLAQGLEFHLMAGPDERIPAAFLPEGFSITCESLDSDDLPDYAERPMNGKVLSRLKVTVLGLNNEDVTSFTTEKIMDQEGN